MAADVLHAVNIDIFALYIFSHYSHLSHIRENMNNVKISFTMPYRVKNKQKYKFKSMRNCLFSQIRENVYTQ